MEMSDCVIEKESTRMPLNSMTNGHACSDLTSKNQGQEERIPTSTIEKSQHESFAVSNGDLYSVEDDDGDGDGSSHLYDSDEDSENDPETSVSAGGVEESSSLSDDLTESDSETSSLSSRTLSSYEAPHRGLPTELELTANAVAVMSIFMQSQKAQAAMIGLAERGKILSSINWLASHVPVCVLNILGDEARAGMQGMKSSTVESLVTAYLSTDGESSVQHTNIYEIESCNRLDMLSDLSRTDDLYTHDAHTIEHKRVAQHEEDEYAMSPAPHPVGYSATYARGFTSVPLSSGSEDEQKYIPRQRRSIDDSINLYPLLKGSITQLNDERKKPNISPQSTRRQTRSQHGPMNGLRTPNESLSSFDSSMNNSQVSISSRSNDDLVNGVNGIGVTMQRLNLGSNMTSHTEENSDADDSIPNLDAIDNKSGRHKPVQRILEIEPSITKSVNACNLASPNDTSDDERKKRRAPSELKRSLSRNSVIQRHSFLRRNALGRRNEEIFLLPYSTRHHSALLFIDISGFTKLATTLNPESLSKAINSYFQLIVNVVVTHGGDVLKFAGDAMFVEWKATPLYTAGPQLLKTTTMPLEDCVTVAAICASEIVAQCSDFLIFAHGVGTGGQGAQVASLNVHCGLGAGEMVGVHVGDYDCMREFVMLGDPIDQASRAVDAASLGEVAISPGALMTLSKSCSIDPDALSVPEGHAVVIAQRCHCRFAPTNRKSPQCSPQRDTGTLFTLSTHVEEWPIETLKLYRKLISLYAHPVVVNNDTSQSRIVTTKSSVQERHREEAELRSVYAMFITPLISTRLSGNEEIDRYLFKLLNNIINLTTRELNRFSGHLRQFIVDDKGLVLIATFGLRGSSFPNLVAERALPATIEIHNALQNELGVRNQIGATIGNAYCGVVGGIKRHEYAVLGPSINLAARLMGSTQNPGILVDDAVRMMADRSYGFNALPPVKAKGYSEPVPIFEPLSPLERSWGRVQPNFVGRKKELKEIMGIARDMVLKQCKPKILFLSAESGMGKSTLVVHAIEHIRKMIGSSRHRLIVAKHVSNESEMLVPFGMFRSILIDVMKYFHSAADDRSLASNESSEGLESIGWESLSAGSFSGGSFGASVATGMTRSADRLGNICRELNAPPGFQELVGHQLLGIDSQCLGITIGCGERNEAKRAYKPNNMKALVAFMAKTFRRCTQDASLVIIALDDVHHTDDMSWRVVEELFAMGTGMLFICTCRPLITHKLSIPPEFWDALNGVHEVHGRFISIKLDCLGVEDIRDMIAKTLGLQESQISSILQRDVLMHSGGMPHFVNEILEVMKRRHPSDGQGRRTDDDCTEPAFASVGELLLHRVDSLDASVRIVLHVGAILGNSFVLSEIVAVMQRMSGEDRKGDEMHTDTTIASLELAVHEGILYLQYGSGESDDADEGTFGESITSLASSSPMRQDVHPSPNFASYTFCHDTWRTTILNLMLDSRKRDMHRIIAETLEAQHGEELDNYLPRMKLFSHWKASGEPTKAANLALSIGNSFEELGLQEQGIKLYEDAIETWHDKSSEGGGFTKQVLDSINATDLECIINVYVALGKCLASVHKAKESVIEYQNALNVLQSAKTSKDLKDRTIVFPIFNGLFSALKFGQIEQDDQCSYEETLVGQYVHETRLHGDPIHHARSLAMQGELYGRLALYDKAFAAKDEMVQFYDPRIMSAGLCAAYGSDRSAQLNCMSILWHRAKYENEKAVDTCWYIINELMPLMDLQNVHNSCMIMFPVIWTLKDSGYALEARKHFTRIVVDAFDEHYGDGRSTFCLPVYDPILMLLDLTGGGSETEENFAEYVDWALGEENLRFGTVINCSLGNFGRCADSITAEICYLLAKELDFGDKKRVLAQNGLDIAMEVIYLTEKKHMIHARREIEPIYQQLSNLAQELGIEI